MIVIILISSVSVHAARCAMLARGVNDRYVEWLLVGSLHRKAKLEHVLLQVHAVSENENYSECFLVVFRANWKCVYSTCP